MTRRAAAIATALALLGCNAGGGGGGGVTADLLPCAEGVVDTWTFESSPGLSLVVQADTVDAETAADLCLSGSCEGDDPFAGDDQLDCSFPPPRFRCPRAQRSLSALATCEVRVSVCSDACASAAAANYRLSVEVGGNNAPLTLVSDDETDGPGVTIPSTTTTTTTTSTTLPSGQSCPITFRATNTATIGTLGYDVDYSAADGYFAGSAGNADCTPLAGNLAAVNDCDTLGGCGTVPFRTLRMAVLSLTGFAAPTDVARCTFKTIAASPTSGDFAITVTGATDASSSPITVTMTAQVGACTPDPGVTTTTVPGGTTTSTTTTTAANPTTTTMSTSSSSMP